VHQVLLEFDGADGGVDLQGRVKLRVVRHAPWWRETARPRDGNSGGLREGARRSVERYWGKRDKQPVVAHVQEIFVALNAVETFVVGYLILADEDLARALQRPRNDEASAFVVETGRMTGVAAASSTVGSCGLGELRRTTPTTGAGLDTDSVFCAGEESGGSLNASGRDVPWMATGSDAEAVSLFRGGSCACVEFIVWRVAAMGGGVLRLEAAGCGRAVSVN